jgi:hypothetical protein
VGPPEGNKGFESEEVEKSGGRSEGYGGFSDGNHEAVHGGRWLLTWAESACVWSLDLWRGDEGHLLHSHSSMKKQTLFFFFLFFSFFFLFLFLTWLLV